MKQYVITPAAGKRLIGKGIAKHPDVRDALNSGILVIVAGTTNGYVAEELLSSIGGIEGFQRRHFFRGITMPHGKPVTKSGRLRDESGFPGDVIIDKGTWQKGKTIYDVIDDLKEGDVILKGVNALDLLAKRAAILIGDPKAGTIGVALQAMIGRRVRLILPVGLEKRISGDLDDLALRLNAPGAHGPRLLPIPAQVFTEIDAISILTGAVSELVAGGGVCGAEGSIRIVVTGEPEQIKATEDLMNKIGPEPMFDPESVISG